MIQKLSDIKSKIDKLADKIQAPVNMLPTYGYSEHNARPHIEIDSKGYHFVINERGQELERHTTFDIDDFLYNVFKYVSFDIACIYELNHRIIGQDFRRILFKYQEDLLSRLSPIWGERRAQEHAQILQSDPFDDVCDA